MKILFIFSNYHLSHITAQPGIALKLAHKAATAGHEVTILANTDKELLTKDEQVNLVLFKGLGDLTTYLKNFLTIIRTIYKKKPEVIHIHGHLLFIMISLLNIFFRVPITFFSSETIEILTPWQKRLFIPALALARRVFVTSEFIRQEFAAVGIDKKNILLAHIGIADNFYNPPVKQLEDIDILFFGDSKVERGFDRVEQLVSSLPQTNFHILLRWSTPEQLRHIKQYKNVTILHHPYKVPLTDFIARSKVILLPFRFMGVRPPVSILEAMILEKCVITSTMGGNEEVITNNVDGILDDFTSMPTTKKTLVTLIEDKSKRSKLAQNARKKMLTMYNKSEYNKVINHIETITV